MLTVLLSACSESESPSPEEPSGLSLLSVVETNPSPAPIINLVVSEFRVGEQRALDLSSEVSSGEAWQITDVLSVTGPVRVALLSATELEVIADGAGMADVTYRVESGGNIYQGYMAIVVSSPVNTSPSAADIQLISNGTAKLEIDLSRYISDRDGDELTVTDLLQSDERFVVDGHILTYHANGFVGIDSATYIVTDGKGGWAAGLIQMTVTDNTPPPATLSVSTLVQEMTTGQSVTLDISSAVTASDSWQISQVTPSNSAVSASIASDNEISLSALAAGVTEVVYTLVSSGVVATGTLVVAVSDLDNNLPYANDLNSSTDSLTNLTISLNGAYGDVDGDAVSVTELLQADSRFALSGELVTYSPGGFIGVDTATYLVSDGRGGMAAGLLVVNVTDASPAPDNTSPTAADYSFSTDSVTQVTLDLAALGLVADADSDPLSIAIFGGDSRVAVSGLTLEYTPGGYVGADEFVYQVSDGKGGSALGHISATVSDATPANQIPTAAATTLTLTLQQIQASSQRVIDLTGLVSDADGDSLSVTQVYGALGSVTISGTLELTYTASASIPADSFSYVVSDGKGGFALGTVNVSIDNQAPVAQPITLAIDPYAGGSLSIDLSLYTSDADGDSLTLSELGSATAPATISSTGLQLEYTPNGFTGTDSISYSVTDGLATASNVIQITSSSQAVLTANNITLGSYAMDAGLQAIDVSAFVSNSTGRNISLSRVYGAVLGTTALSASDLVLNYTPDDISYGSDSFFYEVTDGEGNLASAAVSLTISAPAEPAVTSLSLDYSGPVASGVSCTGCDHPTRTEYQFEVDSIPVTGSDAEYALVDDDKDYGVGVRVSVKNRYCNADGSGVNGGNACKTASAQVVIRPEYIDEVIANDYAMTALRTDGFARAWGLADYGGDSSGVQSDLVDVESVTTSNKAFAARKSNGSLVVWGNANYGGDASSVHAQLNSVIAVYATDWAFAAVKADGSVVTWGDSAKGGDSSGVQAQLTNVIRVFSTNTAFAALKQDGTVICWGESGSGGNCSGIAASLVNVAEIYNNDSAFAALKVDGTVVAWGNTTNGGDASAVQADLTNISKMFPNRNAFAALKTDGSVITWGALGSGGSSASVQADLTNVKTIASNYYSFAALKGDGSVVTWGSSGLGGDSSAVQAGLTNVEQVFANSFAYAALKSDKTLVTWGNGSGGGDSSAVQADLVGVKFVSGGEMAFAAALESGDVVTWGVSHMGGDSSAVQSQFNGVTHIWHTYFAYVARNQDGSLVTWGTDTHGGDSSALQDDFTHQTQLFLDLDL
ncbi:Ig-like domain-containing protein [Shewanella corallii]|uniref:Ig-like domain-containing protein n=1 Tax=Shewanella corallii TaxID=560080 RepID=A0ABT0N618_9GAMM|nr:Ig-like domain-containing protein [Shewanella corallii]MCL2913886.1 Ig-like domain-containing protein [Shewanella corallii]